jgi:hypothetical protein
MVEHKKLRRLDWAPHEHCMVTACPVGWTLSQALCQNLVEARVACPQPPDSSESRIFWSRIGGNCDHFQNLFWKWSKYIDIKFEYGISTHQINDHNYFIIFNFFFYLFLNVCLIIYKLYFANFSQHFFSIIICTKISDVIFTIKFMVIVFLLWNASELISTILNINFIMIVFTCWKVSKHIYVVIKTNHVSIKICGEWFQFLLRYCIMLDIDKFTTILIVVLEWF